MTGIYKITNNINGKSYIGQATNIAARWRDHLFRPFEETCDQYNSHLYRAIRDYGIENFSFSILERCEKEELNEKEQYWVDKYDSFNRETGYNLTKGGDGTLGSSIFLDAISVSQIQELLQTTDRTQWDIAREFEVDQAMISNINNGNLWYNNQLKYPLRQRKSDKKYFCADCGIEICRGSERCISCARKSQTKRPPSDTLKDLLLEHNGSFIDVGKLYNVSDNAVRKWCKFYGMSYRAKDYMTNIEKRPKQMFVPVQQIDIKSGNVVREFKTIAEAEKITGITHVWDVCHGYRKSAGGYFWKLVNSKENVNIIN